MTAAEKLAKRCDSLSTAMLCVALTVVDQPKPSTEERIVRSQVIDTLCARHPQVDAAFDRWAADESTDGTSPVEVIVTAALQAIGA